MNWAYNLLVSLDQLFNTIAGGNPDVTISGHAGYKATKHKQWRYFEKLIDFTFKPNDNDIDDSDNLVTTSIVAIIGCVILIPIIRICGFFHNSDAKTG